MVLHGHGAIIECWLEKNHERRRVAFVSERHEVHMFEFVDIEEVGEEYNRISPVKIA